MGTQASHTEPSSICQHAGNCDCSISRAGLSIKRSRQRDGGREKAKKKFVCVCRGGGGATGGGGVVNSH